MKLKERIIDIFTTMIVGLLAIGTVAFVAMMFEYIILFVLVFGALYVVGWMTRGVFKR